MLALMSHALLQGRANQNGTACFWVGDQRRTVVLLWPAGYYARGNPLSIFDRTGRRHGTAGQRVRMGGGHLPASPRILGCSGFQDVWSVGSPAPE